MKKAKKTLNRFEMQNGTIITGELLAPSPRRVWAFYWPETDTFTHVDHRRTRREMAAYIARSPEARSWVKMPAIMHIWLACSMPAAVETCR